MANNPIDGLTRPDASALLDVFARLGLARYVQTFDDPEPALRLILTDGEAAAHEMGIAELGWRHQLAALRRAWDGTEGGLPRLADSLSLTMADLFLVGLAVACERRRTVALAVAALQAPFTASRVAVHLALDFLQVLFDADPGDAMALATGRLTESGLLVLEGSDALPQRTLTVRVPLWQALAGDKCAWPGCRPFAGTAPVTPLGETPLGVSEVAIRRAAGALATGEAGGVVVRGPPGSGRAAVAVALARCLGRAAIEVPLAVFREDRGFATACGAAGWMPVLRLATGMGEAAGVGETGSAGPVCVLAGTHGAVTGDRLIELAVAPPPAGERVVLWHAALGGAHAIDPVALATPVLYPATIAAVARSARVRAQGEGRKVAVDDLVEARLALAPDELGRLAHRVSRKVGPGALVANAELGADLAAVIGRCQQRESIWTGLGPSLTSSATLGVRVLFAGESGTGKTMAAAYVANALCAPLFRCDIAAVMNKYIGESEKNLGAMLDHAEAADVVLLFDEADALFGRRTEGTETGERYANMLTNYLLTRLEAHNGIVILTCNAKARIDPAFWRRLDHVVDFPMPGYAERLALWKSHLGPRAPEDAVLERLAAYCDLPGGGVRNAVLAAAAMSPPDGTIGLAGLTPALRREYAKLRRTPPAALALAMRAAE